MRFWTAEVLCAAYLLYELPSVANRGCHAVRRWCARPPPDPLGGTNNDCCCTAASGAEVMESKVAVVGRGFVKRPTRPDRDR